MVFTWVAFPVPKTVRTPRAEKRTATNVLVQAADLRDAVKKLDEGMKGTMADYVIASVAETPLMDVYPYSAEPDVKPEFPDAGKTA